LNCCELAYTALRQKCLETPVVRARGQKIEEHVVADLVLRNNADRPSLTSDEAPVAEERQ